MAAPSGEVTLAFGIHSAPPNALLYHNEIFWVINTSIRLIFNDVESLHLHRHGIPDLHMHTTAAHQVSLLALLRGINGFPNGLGKKCTFDAIIYLLANRRQTDRPKQIEFRQYFVYLARHTNGMLRR